MTVITQIGPSMERIRAGVAVLAEVAFTASALFVALLLETIDGILFIAQHIFVFVFVSALLMEVQKTWRHLRMVYV